MRQFKANLEKVEIVEGDSRTPTVEGVMDILRQYHKQLLNAIPDTEELCFNHQIPIPCDSCTGSTVKETMYRPEYLAEIRDRVKQKFNHYGASDLEFLLHTIDEKDKKLERFEKALRRIVGRMAFNGYDAVMMQRSAKKALYD